ncbi:MAG: rhomboid family intramembrane serine protease [bacterium]|nr:rhomboid family intramembrane serine protease [bacterium]
MIIPIGHEQSTVRRLPWVTFTIIGLCVIAFVVTLFSMDPYEDAAEWLTEAIEYFQQHPYLEPDERILEIYGQGMRRSERDAFLEVARQMMKGQKPLDPDVLADEQAHLDQLTEMAFGSITEGPLHKWGLIPAHKTLHGVFTYMFMHGGWAHLIFNMLFLFLAGPCLEDVWGRPIFTSFYVVSGVVVALLYAAKYPGFEGPLVGASGAVAALMGAFAVRFWKSKIKLLYFFFLRMGTVTVPAWLVLPAWLLRELVFADAIDRSGEAGGVAYWAHIFGFGGGALFAFVMMRMGIEEKYIHEKIEAKITLHDNTSVDSAMEELRQGNRDEAEKMLRQEIQENPSNTDACVALWNLLSQVERHEEGIPFLLKVIQKNAQEDDLESLILHWPMLLGAAPDAQVDSTLALRVGEVFDRAGEREHVDSALDVAVRSMADDPPIGVLARMARLAARNRSPHCYQLIDRCLEHPELPPDARAEFEEFKQEIDGQSVDAAPSEDISEPMEEEPVVATVSQVPHTVQVMEATPTRFDGTTLVLNAKGTQRNLGLEKVQAISVAGVERGEGRPVLLIDLLLDPPWGDRAALRVVRMYSNGFDPRKLVGGDNAGHAFKAFIKRLLEVTEAVPLPDPDAVLGQPFSKYSSLDSYQREVLDVTPG